MWYFRNRVALGALPQLMVEQSYLSKSGLWLEMEGEDDGTTFTDLSPNGLTITSSNVVTKTGTKYDGVSSAYFNGSNAMLTFPNNTDFNFSTGDHAIDLYFNASSFSGNCVFSKSDYGTGVDLLITLTNSTTITVLYDQYSHSLVATVPEMSTGQWYRLTVQLNSGQLEIWLDGTKYGTKAATPDNRCSIALAIGAANSDKPGGWFSGYIDRFRIINDVIM